MTLNVIQVIGVDIWPWGSSVLLERTQKIPSELFIEILQNCNSLVT